MKEGTYIVWILLVLPATLFGVLAISAALWSGKSKRLVYIVSGVIYMTFGIGLPLAIGWRNFREEFWGAVVMLLILNLVIAAGLTFGTRRRDHGS